MDEAERRRAWLERKRAAKAESTIPWPSYPTDSPLSVKSIAWLCVYCKKSPEEVAHRFRKVVSIGDVHAALARYYRDPEPIDRQISEERRLNSGRALVDSPLTLPKVEPD